MRPASAADDSPGWTQFRGPGGLGHSDAKDLPETWSQQENLAWKAELPGAGTSSPVILGDRIYLTCYSGYGVPDQPAGEMEDLRRHLVCLNRADGALLWSKEVESKLPEQASIREGHGYASSTPATDGQRLYVFFGKTGLLSFDLEGSLLWKADVGSGLNNWGSATSPVLHGGLVIVNASVESDSMLAFDKKTGREVWRAEGIKESWNTPLLVQLPGGKTELVVAIQGKLLGFDPAAGQRLWSCDTDITWYMAPSVVAHEGIVYCIGGRSGRAALAARAGGRGDVTKTHRQWTGSKGSNVSSPIYHQGHLYWVNDSLGIACCADAKTGDLRYEERLPRAGQFYASPILAGGKIYYTSRTGKTFVLAAQPEFELLATNDLSDRSTFNSSPSIAGDRIYLRSNKFLYAIGR